MRAEPSVTDLLLPEDVADLLRVPERVLSALRGSTVLLTGATGFMGKWLLASLALWNDAHALGVHCLALSRDPSAFLARWPAFRRADVSFLAGDIRQSATLSLPGKIDVIVHAAADALPNSGAEEMRNVIVDGTEATLCVAERCHASRYLYVSSGAVYGPMSCPAREDDVCRPEGVYGCAKREAEERCLARSISGSSFSVTIARCFAFAGPWLPLDRFAVGNFIRDRLAGRAIEILGDGEDIRSYMYPTDMVLWLWTILSQGRAGNIYNIGADDGRTLAEMARLVAGDEVPVHIEGNPDYGNGTRKMYLPCTDKARHELGLAVAMPLDTVLERSCAWNRLYADRCLR